MKYPKLLALALSFVAALLLLHWGVFDWVAHRVGGYGYLSVFVAGILFSISFTTAFSIAYLVEVAYEVNPFMAALVAGAGALTTDLVIFSTLRFSVGDELERLFDTRFSRWFKALWHRNTFLEKIRIYMVWSVAGLIIASPLPDELGVTLLGTVKEVRPRWFIPFCFAVNTLGILLILLAAK